MKKQIQLSSRSEARRDYAPSIICPRSVAWPVLLLAGCCAVLTGLAHPAHAGVTEAWVHRYNNEVSNANDQAVKVVRDAAGDVIVTGTTDDGITGRDMLTMKYSGSDGSVLWQKRYDGPANSDDSAQAVAVDGSGNVLVTGYSTGTNSGWDNYTAKYATADGTLLWEKRYNGPANSEDSAQAVAVDSSGNLVVTGTSYNTNYTNLDYYTAKYAAADGALLWEKRYGGLANVSYDESSGPQAVALDGGGNVVVTGSSAGTNGYTDYYTAKYAAENGALLWEERYNGPANYDDRAQAVAVDGNGNVVVTGNSAGSGSSVFRLRYDYYTAKYAAADGALLWEQRYDGSGNFYDYARALAVDGSGNVVVTGSCHNGNDADYYTAKYAAADGALLWEQRYNGPGDHDEGRAVAVDGSGNVLVTGVSGYANGFGISLDYYTAKYAAADGALLWEKRHNNDDYYGLLDANDEAQAIAVDGSGNVLVTGFSSGSQSGYDYYTAKYAAADGTLLWERRYNGGLRNNDDQAQAVAVDGSGNVVVTGRSASGSDESGNSFYEYYTAKYAPADGALLWEKRYNGPAIGNDYAWAVAVDGSGNVVVTGISDNDCCTAKYAAADGARLWEKRGGGGGAAVVVDGSGNVVVTGDCGTIKYLANGTELWRTSADATALAVDGSGNVVLALSANNGTNHDYYTAKYAAADGTLLWDKRYNGPANNGDSASAVAVDGSGNVVVTGGSSNGTNNDSYTAKYAAANGALHWEKRYNGPANNNDYASAVAVDASGNVVVTGGSSNGTNTDYYTAKYAAADGALLWEQRYNGPANGFDRAIAVAVDGSGNVLVTGVTDSFNDHGGGDYYTAKYATADGALLWEKRYNGPANGNDIASGLALGPNGMVVVTGSSDGNFGFGITYDYATVVYRENLPPVTIALIPEGIRLRFTGVPGRAYNIERAPAVTGPWTTLATPTAPLSGLIEYVDTNPRVSTAFYRTSAP